MVLYARHAWPYASGTNARTYNDELRRIGLYQSNVNSSNNSVFLSLVTAQVSTALSRSPPTDEAVSAWPAR